MAQRELDCVLSLATEVFGRPAGPADSFFDLGGDSLTAVQFCLRIEDVLGGTVDIDDLINAADLRAFADALAAGADG